jgi:hypothetical protein
VKNGFRDAADRADLLRMGPLPEAWIAPPPVRAHRELVRHQPELRRLCSGIKTGAHAVLAKFRPAFGLPAAWRIPVIVATPEVFGSCDGWGSAGSGAADGEA